MLFNDQLRQLGRFMFMSFIILASARCTKISNDEMNLNTARVMSPCTPSIITSWVAGTGAAGFTDGPVATATMYNPKGITVDASGNIYFSDLSNHAIRKITTSGTVVTIAGNGTAGFADGTGSAARFNTPFGIDLDNQGNIIVADMENHAIRKVTPAGVVTTIAGGHGAGLVDGLISVSKFNRPMDVSVDLVNNDVYVCDYNNQRIRKVKQLSQVWTVVGNGAFSGAETGYPTSVRLLNAHGIDFNTTTGNLYIGDMNRLKLDASLNVSILATDPLVLILSIKEDAAGNLYYTTVGGDGFAPYYVKRYNRASGTFSILGGGPAGYVNGDWKDARFNTPWGLWVNPAGSLVYVADGVNNRIRKIVITSCP